jgi:putative DNA primase/helicase
VGWQAGNATLSAKRCFDVWLHHRGGRGAQEVETAIGQLRLTIERDGDSRFQPIEFRHGKWAEKYPVKNRLGFVRKDDGDTEYLIQPETWNELMSGRDAAVAKQLATRGILKSEAGRPCKKLRLPGFPTPQRVYVIGSSALFADSEGGR